MVKKERQADDAMPDVAAPVALSYDVEDRFDYDVAFNMAFIGLGEGGGRIADTFFKLGYGRVGVINTYDGDMKQLSAELPRLDLQIGGAGKDRQKGANAITGQAEAVFELLTRAVGKKPDYLLICAGLGGGTGSGGAVPLIEIARRYMLEHDREPSRVGVIITIPHHAEGFTPCRNAYLAFEQIHRENVSPMFVIDNKRIGDLFPEEAGVNKFYGNANLQVARLFHLFNRFAKQRSSIATFDRADFASLLDSGLCVFGASAIESYKSAADISESVRMQLGRTVLAEVDLKRGKKAGCLFMGGEKILDVVPMDFFDGGFTMLTRLLAEGSIVHRGIYQGSSSDLRCYTMIAGLPPPAARLRRIASEGGFNQEGLADFLGVNDAGM